MSQINPTAKNGGGRGLSWRQNEIPDLFDLWCEEKINNALRLTHRNTDHFESIAKDIRRHEDIVWLDRNGWKRWLFRTVGMQGVGGYALLAPLLVASSYGFTQSRWPSLPKQPILGLVGEGRGWAGVVNGGCKGWGGGEETQHGRRRRKQSRRGGCSRVGLKA